MQLASRSWLLAASLFVATIASCKTTAGPRAGPDAHTLPDCGSAIAAEPMGASARLGESSIQFPPSEVDAQAAGDERCVPVRYDAELRPTSSDVEPLSAPSPGVALSLSDVIGVSLQRNPALVTLRSSEPVAHAAYHVAETYPYNPQFQTQILPFTRDRNGNENAPVSQQHVIVETFELSHQQRHREEAADAFWAQTRWNIQQAELQNIVQSERLFFAAFYQRELRDLAASLAALNRDLTGVLERRFTAGQAANADLVLARLEYQSAQRQADLAQANYETALSSLRTHLAFGAGVPVELAGDWKAWQWLPASVAVGCPTDLPGDGPVMDPSASVDVVSLRQLVTRRPDVIAARAAAEAARANLRLANAARVPNLQAGPMYQRDDAATQFWGLQAQMDIPVINTGKPLVRQRELELRQQEITAAQLESQALAEAGASVERYDRARRFVQESQRGSATAITDVLRPVEDQFEAGVIDLLRVYAARTSLIQARRGYLDLLNETAQAAAEVTLTTGILPNQLIADQAIGTAELPATLPAP